jgi:hypothetical protein
VERSARLLRPSSLAVGGVAIALGAALMGMAARANPAELFSHDALAYRLVAENPFADGSVLAFGIRTTGTAYRYGRVGYPLLAWILALGQSRFVGWTMGLVSLVSVGGIGAIAAELCDRRGHSPWRGLGVLAAPALLLSMGVLFAEPLAIGLMLLLYLLWIDQRFRAAAVVGALLVLTRETAVIALVPLVWHAWRAGERRLAIRLASTALVPYLAWSVWVRVRVGQFPFLDNASSARAAIGPPLLGYAHRPNLVIAGATIVTVVLAVWLLRANPWTPVTQGALLFALIPVCFTAMALQYTGDTLRIMGPAQALALLGFLASVGPRREQSARESPASPSVLTPG